MNRALRGDAETVVFKAISKEPDRRYQTAAEFAGDIRRFLANEPILARRPSASYQLAKFARRNRPLVAGVAAAFVVLLASLLVISGLLVRTMRAERNALLERDEAALQAAIAEEINDFLVVDLIAAVSPDVTPDRDVTLLDLLDAASRRIDGRFTEQPAVEAALRRTIAITYWDLGRPSIALPHGERAVELFRQEYGEGDERTLMAMANLGDIYRSLQRLDDADRMHSTVLASQRAKPVREPSQFVMALFNLGSLRRVQGRFDEALDLLQEASDTADATLPVAAIARLNAKGGLAGLLRERGRVDEAIQIYESLNLTAHLATGIGVPNLLRSLGGLALAYSTARRFEDSERVYHTILDTQSAVLGDRHPDTIQTETNLCLLLIRTERHEEARQRLEILYERSAEALGLDHPQTLLTGFQLGKSLTNTGDPDQAAILLSDLHTRSVGAFGDQYPISLVVCHELARAHNALGDHERAKALTEDLVESGLAVWPRHHEAPAYFMQVRADALAGIGESGEALTLYTDAIAILQTVDPENVSIREMQQRAASLQRSADISTAPPAGKIIE
jgi:tetratricopeptide (TPR) repeat protein